MSIFAYWYLFILTLLSFQILTKRYRHEFRSTNLQLQKSWIFLDRMKFQPGFGTVRFGMELLTQTQPARDKYKVSLLVVAEKMWDQEIESKCFSEAKPKQVTQSLSDSSEKFSVSLILNPPNISSTSQIKFLISEPTTFYFVLSDCEKSLINQYFNKKSRFIVDLNITNNDKNYGSDESILNLCLPFLLFLLIWVVGWLGKKNRNGTDNFDQINWLTVLLRVTIWGQVFGLGAWYFGHLIYVFNGHNYQFFEFCFLVGSAFAEVMLLLLLTFCSYGWMTKFRLSQSHQKKYPLAAILGIVYLILAMMMKITDGEANKTHIYDSMPFYGQVIIKSIAFCAFLIGSARSFYSFGKQPSFVVYILSLTLIGILAFIGMPLIVLWAESGSKHDRWVFVSILPQILRSVILAILAWEVKSHSSVFGKLNLHGRSFMQDEEKYL